MQRKPLITPIGCVHTLAKPSANRTAVAAAALAVGDFGFGCSVGGFGFGCSVGDFSFGCSVGDFGFGCSVGGFGELLQVPSRPALVASAMFPRKSSFDRHCSSLKLA